MITLRLQHCVESYGKGYVNVVCVGFFMLSAYEVLLSFEFKMR